MKEILLWEMPGNSKDWRYGIPKNIFMKFIVLASEETDNYEDFENNVLMKLKCYYAEEEGTISDNIAILQYTDGKPDDIFSGRQYFMEQAKDLRWRDGIDIKIPLPKGTNDNKETLSEWYKNRNLIRAVT
jgi:hypothetical protein